MYYRRAQTHIAYARLHDKFAGIYLKKKFYLLVVLKKITGKVCVHQRNNRINENKL